MNCLYAVSDLSTKPNITTEDLVRGTVDLIPMAWQYPDITCARINLDYGTYVSPDFEETEWIQFGPIVVNGKNVGSVDVCYKQEMPELDEGPFTKEERNLLNAIALRLGEYLERKLSEDALLQKKQGA